MDKAFGFKSHLNTISKLCISDFCYREEHLFSILGIRLKFGLRTEKHCTGCSCEWSASIVVLTCKVEWLFVYCNGENLQDHSNFVVWYTILMKLVCAKILWKPSSRTTFIILSLYFVYCRKWLIRLIGINLSMDGPHIQLTECRIDRMPSMVFGWILNIDVWP